MLKKLLFLFQFLFFINFLMGCLPAEEKAKLYSQEVATQPPSATMELTSSAFKHNGKIPSKYTCEGENVSPPLKIDDAPLDVKSFVLIMDDPDAVKPAGKIWVHWVVFNIPGETEEIAEGEEPKGVQGEGTSGDLGYQGPCPPDGEHRYFFRLYALDEELPLKEGATKVEIEDAMEGHILEEAELVGKYKKKK